MGIFISQALQNGMKHNNRELPKMQLMNYC